MRGIHIELIPTIPNNAKKTHHPELVRILSNKYGPMLRRVRVVPDPLRDHLPQAGVLREPLSGEAADRVPSDLDRPGRAVEDGLRDGNDIWLVAEADGVFESELTLCEILLPIRRVSEIDLKRPPSPSRMDRDDVVNGLPGCAKAVCARPSIGRGRQKGKGRAYRNSPTLSRFLFASSSEPVVDTVVDMAVQVRRLTQISEEEVWLRGMGNGRSTPVRASTLLERRLWHAL